MSFSPSGFRNTLKHTIKYEMNVVGLDTNINEPAFAENVAFLIQNTMDMKHNFKNQERLEFHRILRGFWT